MAHTNLSEKRQALIDELSPFEDPQERFQYLIDCARGEPSWPDDKRLDVFLIEGCVSRLWVIPRLVDGVCRFECDSDAVITKGIAMLVCGYYDGAAPAEVLADDAEFLASVGISQHLSPNRRNGLSNLVAKIRAFAEHCLSPEMPSD